MVKLYMNGTVHDVDEAAVHIMEGRGFTRKGPTPFDLGGLDNEALLHVAAIANLQVPADASREDLETIIREAWEGLGSPPGFLENALAAPAPVAPEDFDAKVDTDPGEVTKADDFEAGILGEPITVETVELPAETALEE